MSDLNQLHQAISATIAAAMPQLATVGSHAVVQEGSVLPALFHSIVRLKPGIDPGDGHSCIDATFEARIHVDASHPQAAQNASTLAAQLVVLLRKQYWEIDFVEEARVTKARPLYGTPSAWRVRWKQVLHLGEAQWPWPNQPPGSLVFAFDPDAGSGNEGNYKSPEDFA